MKASKGYLKNLYLKLSGIFLARYYSSLDTMPIAAFIKAMAGDLKQVSRNVYYNEVKALKAWEKLFNAHLKANGLPEQYEAYMKKMDKANDCYDKAYNGGKRWLLVKARVYEAEARLLLKGESESIELTCARISKFVGFSVKASECSVSEFYSYVNLMAK